MSLIFRTDELTAPGVYTYTVPSGVGDIEMHLWGAGGGDGAKGPNETVTLNPGSAAQSTSGGSNTYTSSGKFTVPPLVTSITVTLLGGGGGAGGSHSGCDHPASHHGGAGGGGESVTFTQSVTPGQEISFTVGSGGAGGAAQTAGAGGTASSMLGRTARGGGGGSGGVKGAWTDGVSYGGGNGGAPTIGSGARGGSGSNGSVSISYEGVYIPAVAAVTNTIVGSSGGKGAGGGYSYTKVRVHPGDTVIVAVGARGENGGAGGASATTPTDYSGGSGSAGSSADGGGGGGATVVLVNNTVVAVAGGGGGGGAGGLPGYTLTPTTVAQSNTGAEKYDLPGVYTWKVPEGVTSVNVDLIGAGGGGGGSDSNAGYPGSDGGAVGGTIAVSPGDYLTIGVGQGGRPGQDNSYGSSTGAAGGESLNGQYSGGRGGDAGPTPYSGSGGGGGGATVILKNGVAVAVAYGGGGGGGGGNHSAGQAAIQSQVGITNGAQGQDKSGDGAGGGGGGGGASGGAGGSVRGGDDGAYSGSNGTNLIPAAGSSAAGATGGLGAIRGTRGASAGANGKAQISWAQTLNVPGTSLINVSPAGKSVGGDGTPATNVGSGYATRGLGQSSTSGSSAGGGGGGGFYGGIAGISGPLGGGGQGGTNFGNVVYAGSGVYAGGKTLPSYPGATVGDSKSNGAAIINFIKSFTFSVKKDSKWHLVDQGWTKVAGAWKEIYNGYVKVDGHWYLINDNPSVTLPSQSYSISANVSSIDEGEAILFTLTSTGADVGTIVPYTTFGISSDDLEVGSATGRFVVGVTDSVTFVPKVNPDTTGERTLTVELTGKDLRRSVLIRDVMLTPSVTILSNVAVVNEGQAVQFTLDTAHVATGTVIPYTITGIESSDLTSGSLTGDFIVGSAESIELSFANDLTTEGHTVIIVRSTGSYYAICKTTLLDTSLTPHDSFTYSYANPGPGSWTVPAGVTSVSLRACGGGGGGGGADSGGTNHAIFGQGGYASDYQSIRANVNVGDTVTWSIGAGGTGASTSENYYPAGGTGGTTTISINGNVTLTATGGIGGTSRWSSSGPNSGQQSVNGGANGGHGSAGSYNSAGSSGDNGKIIISY